MVPLQPLFARLLGIHDHCALGPSLSNLLLLYLETVVLFVQTVEEVVPIMDVSRLDSHRGELLLIFYQGARYVFLNRGPVLRE